MPLQVPDNLRPRYPGTVPFGDHDSLARHIFCGRDEEIEDFIQVVDRNPITLLYGKTGAGKSSFVKCGVTYELNKRFQIKTIHIDAIELLSIASTETSDDDNRILAVNMLKLLSEPLQISDKDFNQILSDFSDETPITESNIRNATYDLLTLKAPEEFECNGFVTIIDQFEFIKSHKNYHQVLIFLGFIHGLYDSINANRSSRSSPIQSLIVVMRKEFLHVADKLSDRIPYFFSNLYKLNPINISEAEICISKPAELKDNNLYTKPWKYSEPAIKQIKEAVRISHPNEDTVELLELQRICADIEIKQKYKSSFKPIVEPKSFGHQQGLRKSRKLFIKRAINKALKANLKWRPFKRNKVKHKFFYSDLCPLGNRNPQLLSKLDALVKNQETTYSIVKDLEKRKVITLLSDSGVSKESAQTKINFVHDLISESAFTLGRKTFFERLMAIGKFVGIFLILSIVGLAIYTSYSYYWEHKLQYALEDNNIIKNKLENQVTENHDLTNILSTEIKKREEIKIALEKEKSLAQKLKGRQSSMIEHLYASLRFMHASSVDLSLQNNYRGSMKIISGGLEVLKSYKSLFAEENSSDNFKISGQLNRIGDDIQLQQSFNNQHYFNIGEKQKCLLDNCNSVTYDSFVNVVKVDDRLILSSDSGLFSAPLNNIFADKVNLNEWSFLDYSIMAPKGHNLFAVNLKDNNNVVWEKKNSSKYNKTSFAPGIDAYDSWNVVSTQSTALRNNIYSIRKNEVSGKSILVKVNSSNKTNNEIPTSEFLGFNTTPTSLLAHDDKLYVGTKGGLILICGFVPSLSSTHFQKQETEELSCSHGTANNLAEYYQHQNKPIRQIQIIRNQFTNTKYISSINSDSTINISNLSATNLSEYLDLEPVIRIDSSLGDFSTYAIWIDTHSKIKGAVINPFKQYVSWQGVSFPTNVLPNYAISSGGALDAYWSTKFIGNSLYMGTSSNLQENRKLKLVKYNLTKNQLGTIYSRDSNKETIWRIEELIIDGETFVSAITNTGRLLICNSNVFSECLDKQITSKIPEKNSTYALHDLAWDKERKFLYLAGFDGLIYILSLLKEDGKININNIIKVKVYKTNDENEDQNQIRKITSIEIDPLSRKILIGIRKTILRPKSDISCIIVTKDIIDEENILCDENSTNISNGLLHLKGKNLLWAGWKNSKEIVYTTEENGFNSYNLQNATASEKFYFLVEKQDSLRIGEPDFWKIASKNNTTYLVRSDGIIQIYLTSDIVSGVTRFPLNNASEAKTRIVDFDVSCDFQEYCMVAAPVKSAGVMIKKIPKTP